MLNMHGVQVGRRSALIGCLCGTLSPSGGHGQPARAATFTCSTIDPPPGGAIDDVQVLSAAAGRDEQVVAREAVIRDITPYGVAALRHAWRPSQGREPGSGRIVLGVHFVNGTNAQRQHVMRVAPRWLAGPNPPPIFFRFDDVSLERSDIRVQFGGSEYKSYVGNQARDFLGQTTMWLADTYDEGVTLHEIGHSLGMQHAHFHPDGGIRWIPQRVFAHFGGPPLRWAPEQIEAQVLRRLSGEFRCGPPDLASVMTYPIPEGLAENFTSQPNSRVSDGDFSCLSFLYVGMR